MNKILLILIDFVVNINYYDRIDKLVTLLPKAGLFTIEFEKQEYTIFINPKTIKVVCNNTATVFNRDSMLGF